MATGKSGTITFQSSDYSAGVRGGRFQFSYSETYDISGNYSDIVFSNFKVAGVGNYGRVVLSGKLTADGETLFNLSSQDIGLCSVGNDTFYDMIASSLGWPQTIRVAHGSDGKKTIAIALAPTEFTYFNIWYSGNYVGTNYSSSSQNLVLTDIPRGMVRIHNGSSFDRYSVQIHNGSSWDRYRPYIYNGSSWEPYDGG